MNLPDAPNAGSAAVGAALATIALAFLNLWPAWSSLPAAVPGAADTLIVSGVAWLGGWLRHRQRRAASMKAAEASIKAAAAGRRG